MLVLVIYMHACCPCPRTISPTPLLGRLPCMHVLLYCYSYLSCMVWSGHLFPYSFLFTHVPRSALLSRFYISLVLFYLAPQRSLVLFNARLLASCALVFRGFCAACAGLASLRCTSDFAAERSAVACCAPPASLVRILCALTGSIDTSRALA